MRRLAVLIFALLLLSTAATGCGDDDNEGSKKTSSQPDPTAAQELLPEADPDAPPTTPAQALKETFPAPDTTDLDLRQTAAVRAGQSACKGKTPIQIRGQYLDEAISSGAIDPDSPKGELLSDPKNFRFEADEGPSFAAGQLAAGIYEATLPEATARYGFQGCVYELARVQVRRMKRAANSG